MIYGDVSLTGFKSVKIKFINFKKLISINIKRGTFPGDKFYFTNEYRDENIISYVFNNLIIGDRPKGFGRENIILTNIKRFKGEITFNVSLKKYIDNNGIVTIIGFETREIIMNGFKKAKPNNHKVRNFF